MKKKFVIGVLILVIVSVIGFLTLNIYRKPTVTNNPTEKVTLTIEISNFKFIPAELIAKPGETITVINKDIASHILTSDNEGLFKTGAIGKNQSDSFSSPIGPGEYPFHCSLHPSMKGKIIVKE